MTEPEDVQIHRDPLSSSYRELGQVKAKKGARNAFGSHPSEDDVDAELRKKAAKMGANAVVDVSYGKGVGLTSWKQTTAEGTAVVVD